MQDFIDIARALADEAGEIARKYYRTAFDIERKGDDSPVTIADRAIETKLREMLAELRPDDGILGEEFGTVDGVSGYTWVIDPIDGTKSFMIGRPTFGTLIALCEGDVPVLGIIDQPILRERWAGVRGQATTFNGAEVTTRACASLDEAVIGSTSPAMFSALNRIHEAFDQNCKMVWGGDCYMYGLLASGHLDMTLEACLSPYDFAALVPIIEGAGGKICDWDGAPLTLKSDGRVVALGDAKLWAEVSSKLNAA